MVDLWGRKLEIGHVVTYPTNYRVTALGVVVALDEEPGGLARIAPFGRCYGKNISLNKSVVNESKHRKFTCHPFDSHLQIVCRVDKPQGDRIPWEAIQKFYTRVLQELAGEIKGANK